MNVHSMDIICKSIAPGRSSYDERAIWHKTLSSYY